MLKKIIIISCFCLSVFSPSVYASLDLFKAVKNNNLEEITQALENSDIEAIDASNDDATPLIAASKTNSVDVMRLLIDKGADIEATDGRGRTPLIWASMNNNIEAIQLLIDCGVNINYETNNFATALNVAIAFKKEEAAQLLIDNGAVNKERRR